jgi:hypothetical protein
VAAEALAAVTPVSASAPIRATNRRRTLDGLIIFNPFLTSNNVNGELGFYQ